MPSIVQSQAGNSTEQTGSPRRGIPSTPPVPAQRSSAGSRREGRFETFRQIRSIIDLKGLAVPQGLASGDRLLSPLWETIGNVDEAATHFEDALAFCRKAGYRPEVARTCCDYSNALLVGAGFKPGSTAEEPAKANALLDESLHNSPSPVLWLHNTLSPRPWRLNGVWCFWQYCSAGSGLGVGASGAVAGSPWLSEPFYALFPLPHRVLAGVLVLGLSGRWEKWLKERPDKIAEPE